MKFGRSEPQLAGHHASLPVREKIQYAF